MIFTSPEAVTGLFVVLEGADGSGKSTLVDLVSDELRAAGAMVRTVDRRHPGGHPECARLVEAVGDLFRASEDLELGFDLLSLSAASQYLSLARGEVLAAIRAGEVVIAESWWDKTWVRLSIEAQRCHGLDDADVERMRDWQQSLLTYPLVPPDRVLTILVDADEADRVAWYDAAGRIEPVYDDHGVTSHDPAEFGRFTTLIAQRLRQVAEERAWPTVANGQGRTPGDVASEVGELVRSARASR